MNQSNSHSIKLVQLKTLSEQLQNNIRNIRNEPDVRKWMYTDHTISSEEHSRWLLNLETTKNNIVFAIIDETNEPVGVVSANNLDNLHKHTSWGLYLTGTARGGLGSAIEYHFINFVFDILGMEKLNCEVLEGNDSVIKLHKKFMFLEEGFKRSNIIKNNTRIGVYLLGLTKNEWVSAKNTLFEKYKKIINKFPTSIEWD